MSKINLFIANADGNLDQELPTIERAVKDAEKYVFPKLGIDWDIDLVVTSHMPFLVIPEDGVGGRTYWCDLINIGINPENFSEAKLTEMLIHELCHAARWGKNDEYMKTLCDGLVNEGIATYFEIEYAKTCPERQFFGETIEKRTEKENNEILDKLRAQLDNERYDYDGIFFNGADGLPRWAGYSAGYHIVKKYLEKTGKTIEEAFADNYVDFRKAV